MEEVYPCIVVNGNYKYHFLEKHSFVSKFDKISFEKLIFYEMSDQTSKHYISYAKLIKHLKHLLAVQSENRYLNEKVQKNWFNASLL